MLGCPDNLALGHLLIRLRPLNRALRGAIALRDAEATRMREAGATADAITRGHVDALLDQLDDAIEHRSISAGASSLTDEESAMEQHLREQAAAASARLPLDALRDELGLDDFEIETLALCASVEVDRDYERVLGFVHDEAGRRAISVELACALTATSLRDRVARRVRLGPFARLRRLGLVICQGTGLREELRLAPLCTQALFGAPVDLRLVFVDPCDVSLAPPSVVPADPHLVARAGELLQSRRVEVISVSGRPRLTRDIVAALAARAGMQVRRFPAPGIDAATAAAGAAALGALLWIDLDAIGERPPDDLTEQCRRAAVALVITSAQPWRPAELIASRASVEICAQELSLENRRELWREHVPELPDNALERVAKAFRFDATETAAAAHLARVTATLRTNGHAVGVRETIHDACLAIARRYGERHTTLVLPRRGPDDLVLPADLHRRVLDIVDYFNALPRVMDDWGFARRVSGGGVKALFTGESGTGKTMAAEVVAGALGLPMLKVDLARVVSKWIGETEKNLDQAFSEARDSHAVLLFDEAEALFGARGDVRHGTDRYANLEVSYLLQRLEDHSGVVILATNLRDKIDPAFTRRFHAVIGFPRPSIQERRRIWERVFTPAMPVADDIDFAWLPRLDLTGAGIVGAAQTAAFFAAREETAISMRHVVRGLVRQFQREARVLTAHDLGPYAAHVGAN